MNLNQHYAEWIAGLDDRHIPPEVLNEAKLRILDIVGAMLGGRGTALAQNTAAAVFVPANGSGTPVIGFPGETGVASAALLQGTLGCVLEFDDSHTATGIHSSTPIVAAAIAKARELKSSGPALMRAVLIGNELTCRLGMAVPGALHRVGFHPTGVLSGFGAAYAIADMMGLGARQMASAAGIAGSFASGLLASFQDGTDAKSLHAGWAAASGIQAAGMAKADITGPDEVYEGRFGLFRTHVQAAGHVFDLEAASGDLGSRWECMTIAPRAYPCGHYSQPFIDAALAIVARHRIDPAQVSTIECAAADYMIPLLCEPLEEKISPKTPWHARYSLPFCLAECVVRGRFDKNSLTPDDLRDPLYLALTRAFRYREDPTARDRTRWSGDVTITMKNGERFHHRVEDMLGTPRNPMTEDYIVRKFRHNADGVIPSDVAESVMASILKLESQDDIEAAFGKLSIAAS